LDRKTAAKAGRPTLAFRHAIRQGGILLAQKKGTGKGTKSEKARGCPYLKIRQRGTQASRRARPGKAEFCSHK